MTILWRASIIWVLLAAVFAIYSAIALQNHARFQTYGFDLGIYDQIIWEYAHGLPAKSSLYRDTDALGIHFQPILWLISPLYMFFNDVRALLVFQVLAVVAAAYPLYLIARRRLDSMFAGCAIACSYLFYFGTQRGVFLDFHTDAFFPLLFALSWLGFEMRRFALFTIGVIGLLLLKEWAGPFVVSLGIVVFLLDRTRYLWALVSIGLGTAVFLVAIYGFIVPLAGPGSAVFGYGELGSTPWEVMRTFFEDPSLAVRHFFLPATKPETILMSVLPFGPWMVLAPLSMLLPLEQFALRFWDLGHPYRWGTDLQYSLPLGSLFAVATICGLGVLRDLAPLRLKNYGISMSCVMLLGLTAISQYLYHLPVLGLLKGNFYQTLPWQKDTHAVLQMIPKDARVSAQNNLAPHLSHRERLYVLPVVRDAQFVVADLHSGQSLYNYMMQSEGEMRTFIQEFLASGKWTVHFQQGDAILLRRV